MNWFAKRVGQSLFTIFSVVTISFALVRLMPGGPVDYIRAQLIEQTNGDVDPQQLRQITQTYINVDPDKPLWQQYIDYLVSVFSGDLGQSMIQNEPVTDILLGALPWTVFVMSIGILLSYLVGIAVGALMAYREGSAFDTSSSLLSVVLTSTPYYIAAILFLMFFAYQMPLFPSSGRVDPSTTAGLNLPFLISAVEHAILPIASIVVTWAGGVALTMRGNAIQVLGEDYLRVARLRGISRNRIAFRYVARNAILPLYTGFLITIGNVFGGSIILEYIFNYPGLGYYIYQAVNSRDYPLLMGAFILITVAVVVALLVGDLTYGKLDPRAGSGGDRDEAY